MEMGAQRMGWRGQQGPGHRVINSLPGEGRESDSSLWEMRE